MKIPSVPLPEELYNQLMGGIEPELTTGQVKILEEKYKDESPEQAQARAGRYSKAFATYRKQYAAQASAWDAQLRAYEHAVLAFFERYAQEQEQQHMTNLESSIASA